MLILTAYVMSLVCVLFGYSLADNDCVEPCISRMQKSLQVTPLLQSDNFGQLSFQELAGASSDQKTAENSFTTICSAYEEVDECLERCELTSSNSGKIRQTYAGIRFICVEHKKEFFASLPCLARQEPYAMRICEPQINASLEASNRFSATVVNREQHNIRNRFENLCRRLGEMIACVEPVTREGCGDGAAYMMLKFITVGFGSFEQLYSQLGISDQLPASCHSLLTIRQQSDRRSTGAKVGTGRLSSSASYSFTSSTLFFYLFFFSFITSKLLNEY